MYSKELITIYVVISGLNAQSYNTPTLDKSDYGLQVRDSKSLFHTYFSHHPLINSLCFLKPCNVYRLHIKILIYVFTYYTMLLCIYIILFVNRDVRNGRGSISY